MYRAQHLANIKYIKLVIYSEFHPNLLGIFEFIPLSMGYASTDTERKLERAF